MLEYFTYKKIKKRQAEKKAQEDAASSASSPAQGASPIVRPSETPVVLTPSASTTNTATPQHTLTIHRKPLPVLTREDETYLDRIVSDDADDEANRPPLPIRPSQEQVGVHEGKGKGKEGERLGGLEGEKEAKKGNRLSFLSRTFTKKGRKAETAVEVSPQEKAQEKDDINRVLEDLNLSAVNNRAFSVSAESQALLQRFTIVLKDLINGVPTAYDDLTHLLDGSQETLEKGFDNLPSFLKKLVAQLPAKFTGNLAPELLAAANEAQGLGGAAGAAGFGAAAKNFLTPNSLKDLVTKPGAVVTMLKSIMNVLKLRWPAFMGTNVLLSLGLFVLLFVFWYCHKRGREERLKRESEAQIVDSEGRIVELEDDPQLLGSETNTTQRSRGENRPDRDYPGPSRTETTATERQRSRERNLRESNSLRPDARDHHAGSTKSSRSSRSDRKSLERR